MKKLILPLVLGTMIFTSCEQKAEKAAAFDIEAVKKDIEDWQVNFEAIVKNKDSVGFANLFAENGVRMAPNSVSVEGRANILKSVVEPFKIIGTTNLTLGDAMGDENTITTYGTYEHFTPDGASLDKGKFMGIFKRENGKLIVIRDIWNSDLAPAAPAAPATK